MADGKTQAGALRVLVMAAAHVLIGDGALAVTLITVPNRPAALLRPRIG
jgi:hypothetical protein